MEAINDPPYLTTSNELTVYYTPRSNGVDFYAKSCEGLTQAAQLQHTQLGLVLLCMPEHQFLLTPQYPYCIHSELSPKASSFLQGVHLIAVASISH